MKTRALLFLTAFIQISLVAANTVFLAKANIPGMIVSSFGINWMWTHNVKKTAFSDETDRVIYAVGATCGCLFGFLCSKAFTT